ncbi:MAG: hypothetical protein WCR46_25060, partial [Deltaproteobacteria bacterium]
SLSDTCSPASIGEVFKALFGVQAPVGSDSAAVGVMIARKKAGKLDNVKSPLAYLSALAGKVTPILATSRELNAESRMSSFQVTPPEIRMLVKPTTGISSSVAEPPRLSHADIDRINQMWDAMIMGQNARISMIRFATY